MKICDSIGNLLGFGGPELGFTNRDLATTNEVIDGLSVQASLCGFNAMLDIWVQIRKPEKCMCR